MRPDPHKTAASRAWHKKHGLAQSSTFSRSQQWGDETGHVQPQSRPFLAEGKAKLQLGSESAILVRQTSIQEDEAQFQERIRAEERAPFQAPSQSTCSSTFLSVPLNFAQIASHIQTVPIQVRLNWEKPTYGRWSQGKDSFHAFLQADSAKQSIIPYPYGEDVKSTIIQPGFDYSIVPPSRSLSFYKIPKSLSPKIDTTPIPHSIPSVLPPSTSLSETYGAADIPSSSSPPVVISPSRSEKNHTMKKNHTTVTESIDELEDWLDSVL